MEAINKITKGIHADFNEYDQPPGTMRDSQNGVILDLGEGNYRWTNLKGTTVKFTLNTSDVILKTFNIRDRIFLIVYNNDSDYVIIYEVDLREFYGWIINIWQGSNSELKFDVNHPIRAAVGFYENDGTQRVYITDWNNQPRVINIGTGAVTIDEKFVNFFPEMTPVYGEFYFNGLSNGGSCKAGTYFFAWRLGKTGYYTDWSYLSTPVHVMPGNPNAGAKAYQLIQGEAPDENTQKRIQITIQDLDTDYDTIQVGYFYSNDYNSAESGVVFYDESIASGGNQTIYLNGDEFINTVTLDELIETSVRIEKCKDIAIINKKLVLANITERAELDVSGLHNEGKNNQMQVVIEPVVKKILLDNVDYVDGTSDPFTTNAISGIDTCDELISNIGLIPGLQYQAVSECTFTDDDGAQTISAGDLFTVNDTVSVTLTTGTAKMVLAKSMYEKAPFNNDINNSSLKKYDITDNYYNYKNPLFTNELKGYPAGEKIRLGVLFFDKTGRPYFVRHLIDIVTDDDIVMPSRNEAGYEIHNEVDETTHVVATNGYSYKYILGNVLGIKIKNLDITDIKDDIGGFAIVRAPIIRTRLGYGILAHLLEDGATDIRLKPGFVNFASDVNVWDKGYSFICPEDQFELSDFSIQPGDFIVNSHYLKPYYGQEAAQTGFDGYGRQESNTNHSLYQKFGITVTPTISNSNGEIDAEHEVSAYTRYELADDTGDGISIDPSDATKLFKEGISAVSGLNSYAANTGIVTFNDLDGAGTNIKGLFNRASTNPIALICYIKRDIANDYGGLSDSALANTTYISTGHFQLVNDAVLEEVKSSGRYIFTNIEVFGGDTFVGLFDFNRVLKNDDDTANTHFNHSVIFPIESRINLEMRNGEHISKDRTYSAGNTGGLRRISGGHNWEEFNYNDGYSSEDINDYYLAFPANFQSDNKFDVRARYSPTKSYGELIDSFRQFNALDFKDVDTEFGQINNIKAKGSRLIYWQRDAVGFIPVNERALSSDQFGTPVQLGVGGIFDRNDNMITMLGNSHQFGLTESPVGFHWFDAVRKVYVTLTNNMQFSNDSIAKGLDNFFVNTLDDRLYEHDNPINGFGVCGGYDVGNKVIFTTFKTSTGNYTVGYNIKGDYFIGFFDFDISFYFGWDQNLYAIGDDNHIIYQHAKGNPGHYYGNDSDASFTVVVRDDSAIAKLFDNYEYIASENPFTKILCENSSQSVEELVAYNRNIKFRNKRWFGSFPTVNREKLVDGYLKITFTKEGSDVVTFTQLKSTFRKMF